MTTTHTSPETSTPPLERAAAIGVVSSVIFLGAIFGFYYAWVCSTMWGLDEADPRVAIAAMQAMNASVRNVVFFPVFFLTPFIVLAAALVTWLAGRRRSSRWLIAAGVMSLLGSVVFTTVLNVPLNDALAQVRVPGNVAAAQAIWSEYSSTWQWRNVTRTALSGLALLFAALGALHLRARPTATG